KSGGWATANVPVYDLQLRVDHVVDNRNILVADFSAWVDGIDASGLTDDSRYDFSKEAFECVGTKKYDTAGKSTRTVKHFIRVDYDKLNPIFKSIAELRSFRVWMDKNGKHSVIAEFIDFQNGSVILRTREGAE